MKQRLLPILPLILAQAACGALPADDNTAPVLDTLRGEIRTQTTGLVPSSLRLAVVWTDIRNGGMVASEDLAITPSFPARFSLALTAPPPLAAIASFDARGKDRSGRESRSVEEFRAAVGALVAYDDRNGNGRLDLVAQSASEFVDAIVGADSSARLAYFETLPTSSEAIAKVRGEDGSMPQGGYNVYLKPYSTEPQVSTLPKVTESGVQTAPSRPPAAPLVRWVVPSAYAFTMDLTPHPMLNQFMCASGPARGPSDPPDDSTVVAPAAPSADAGTAPSEKPTTGTGGSTSTTTGAGGAPSTSNYPAAGDPNLTCTADGSSFSYRFSCVTQEPAPRTPVQRACDQYDNAPSSGCLAGWGASRPTPVPANWPCPDTTAH